MTSPNQGHPVQDDAIATFIDTQGYQPSHRRIFAVGGSGYFFDALDVAAISFILPAVAAQWHLSPTATGGIGSSTFVGYFFGALIAGILGDRFGRKPVMLGGLVIYCLAALAGAAATTLPQLMVLRGLGGLGIGMESVIIAPYLTEFVPARLRAGFGGRMVGCMSFGFLAAALLGWLLVPAAPDGWRWLMGLCGAPIVLVFWWHRVLRESPSLLLSHGRPHQAEAILTQIYGQSPSLAAAANPHAAQDRRITALFGRHHRIAILTGCSLWFFLTLAYYAFFTWVPQLLVLNGITISSSIAHSIGTFAAQIPGYFIAAWLNDRIGPRRVVISFMTGAAVACGAICLAPTIAMVTWGGFILSFFLNGCYAAAYPFTPYLFPAHLRAKGMGLASSVGRFGAIAAPFLIGRFYSVLGLGGVFAAIGCVLLLGVAIQLALAATPRRAIMPRKAASNV